MSTPTAQSTESVARPRQKVQLAVEDVLELVRRDLPANDFFAEFLARLVGALGAAGAAIWVVREDERPELTCHLNLQDTQLNLSPEAHTAHARLAAEVARSGVPKLVPPRSNDTAERDDNHLTDHLLVLAPLGGHQRVEAVLEIFQRPTPHASMRRHHLQVVSDACSLVTGWFDRRAMRRTSEKEAYWRRADELARAAHESLDLGETAYAIANEARRVIGCDRVSVAVRRGSRWKVEAVSGQELFDRRSNEVRLLGQLATRVVASGSELWYCGHADQLLPPVEAALDEYVDHSHAKTVVVVQLKKSWTVDADAEPTRSGEQQDGEAVGALIVEEIDSVADRHLLEPRVELVAAHSARGLANALEHNQLFLLPLWRGLGKARCLIESRTLPKILVAAVLFSALAALCIMPAAFNLSGEGVVRPSQRREVFAALDGVVQRINVAHGERVAKGDVLIELRNTELEVRLTDVIGQRDTVAEQLTAVSRSRLSPSLAPEESSRLAGQQLQLEQRYKSLALQVELLKKKQADLTIRSPMDGVVVTWEVDQQLMYRPVTAGQTLMSIANPGGPWELEVYMPERRMGHLVSARNELGDDLSVSYLVATDPTIRHEGKLREIHTSAELHGEYGNTVSLLVDIDRSDLNDARPGATATAKLHCGTRPLGYVWALDLIEFVQSRVLFHF